MNTVFKILFINFGLFFQSTCVVFTQLFSLLLYPFSYKRYRQFIAYTMRAWSQSLVALVEHFAPTEFVFSFDKSCGPVEDIVQLDGSNKIIGLNLPERMIAIANHQVQTLITDFFLNTKKRFMLIGFTFGALHIWRACMEPSKLLWRKAWNIYQFTERRLQEIMYIDHN